MSTVYPYVPIPPHVSSPPPLLQPCTTAIAHTYTRTFFFPRRTLGGDLLTEGQVGVGVQVTGTPVVAVPVTQLTARCDSAVCATARNTDIIAAGDTQRNYTGRRKIILRVFCFFMSTMVLA